MIHTNKLQILDTCSSIPNTAITIHPFRYLCWVLPRAPLQGGTGIKMRFFFSILIRTGSKMTLHYTPKPTAFHLYLFWGIYVLCMFV